MVYPFKIWFFVLYCLFCFHVFKIFSSFLLFIKLILTLQSWLPDPSINLLSNCIAILQKSQPFQSVLPMTELGQPKLTSRSVRVCLLFPLNSVHLYPSTTPFCKFFKINLLMIFAVLCGYIIQFHGLSSVNRYSGN